MRITIKMTKDDARSLSRFLAVYSEEITEAWFVKRVVEDDYLRLERVVRGVRGERMSFSLDALTVAMLRIDLVKRVLTSRFDESNQFMIIWALEEVERNVHRIQMKE